MPSNYLTKCLLSLCANPHASMTLDMLDCCGFHCCLKCIMRCAIPSTFTNLFLLPMPWTRCCQTACRQNGMAGFGGGVPCCQFIMLSSMDAGTRCRQNGNHSLQCLFAQAYYAVRGVARRQWYHIAASLFCI